MARFGCGQSGWLRGESPALSTEHLIIRTCPRPESTSGSSSTTSMVSVGFDDGVAMALLSGCRERFYLESDPYLTLG